MCEKEKKSFSHRKIVFFSWWRGRAEREEIFFHCGLAWKPGVGFGGGIGEFGVDRSRAIFSFLFIPFPPSLVLPPFEPAYLFVHLHSFLTILFVFILARPIDRVLVASFPFPSFLPSIYSSQPRPLICGSPRDCC